MKRLFVLRHAKSSWTDSELADFDRPLNDRGLEAAPFMGRLMADRNLTPDIILSSPAKRARQTAELVKDAAGWNAELRFDDAIYEASPITLCRVAADLPQGVDSAMVVGHNPGMEGFIRILTGRLEPMSTAALAIINLAIDEWSQLESGTGRLVEVIRPKELMKEAGEV
jgi:phosphohistidine phosphatase